jgi:Ca-activated chloride channel family protein
MREILLAPYKNPEWFTLFALLLLLVIWKYKSVSKESVYFNFSTGVKGSSGLKTKLRPILWILRVAALSALVMALARPQTSGVNTKTKTSSGIDIVLSIDVSSSMLAKDLQPNRLEALKEVASDFVKDRKSDRIGIVVYAGESYTKTPLTTDTAITLTALSELTFGAIEDGTAIGMGLATAVNRLKESDAISKIIILLTDGVNNSGFIEPETAANLALEYGIKIYTIGLGTNGNALSPIAYNSDGSFRYGMRSVEIDEELLQSVSKLTGGSYYRATDNKSLESIYDQINELEKSEIEEFSYYTYEEHFRFWVILALSLLGLELLSRHTIFREALS